MDTIYQIQSDSMAMLIKTIIDKWMNLHFQRNRQT